MKLVYIAGAFRGPNAWEIAQNIRRAEEAGLMVARMGAMPVIPHANTAHFHGLFTCEFWLNGALQLMRRCDAIWVFDLEHLDTSQGTIGEWTEAKNIGLKCFLGLGGLPQMERWIQETD